MDKEDEIWSRDSLPPEEKYQECYKRYLEVEESRKPDPEIMDPWRILKRPKQLAGFYTQHYRYYPEFEQAYRIFEEEEGAGNNPLIIADSFNTLEDYKEASLQDPDDLHHFKGPIEGKKGNHPYTNQQFLDRCFHWLVNPITWEDYLKPGKTPPSRADNKMLDRRNSRGGLFKHGRRIRLLAGHQAKDATWAKFAC